MAGLDNIFGSSTIGLLARLDPIRPGRGAGLQIFHHVPRRSVESQGSCYPGPHFECPRVDPVTMRTPTSIGRCRCTPSQNTVLAFIVDCYLIHRFYTLSKNIFAHSLSIRAHFARPFGYLMGVIPLLTGSGNLADRDRAKIGAMINFITIVVCDILIAAGLIWKLRSMRFQFRTHQLIHEPCYDWCDSNRLCYQRLLHLVACDILERPGEQRGHILYIPIRPLYSLTLLLNFNIRRSSGLSGTSRSKTSEKPRRQTTTITSSWMGFKCTAPPSSQWTRRIQSSRPRGGEWTRKRYQARSRCGVPWRAQVQLRTLNRQHVMTPDPESRLWFRRVPHCLGLFTRQAKHLRQTFR
ncbi:hypothetical protein B0H14DRAFT_3151987 [Mycena olivaceomarginata]|nr:hypothetical protein B0H14DRAFT_3151987 [Mycena olivaceomarginata]